MKLPIVPMESRSRSTMRNGAQSFSVARAAARGIVVAIALLTACSAPSPTSPAEPISADRGDSGEDVLHEWSKVVSVRLTPSGQERTTVGYLDRRFTLSDRDGTTYVLDDLHETRGFILAAGDAYLVVARGSEPDDLQDLGKIGLENGVQRILGVAGTIEIEKIPAR